ncbi:MAG: hypothetical protein SFW35_08540 [Chitinophagales bacterium]|nr:hypothetical protein [Chitinophagales bacterium]
MVIDFIEKGSADCPLIRLYNLTFTEYDELTRQIDKLIKGETNFISLNSILNLEKSIGLEFVTSTEDKGIVVLGSNSYRLELSISSFKEVKDKILFSNDGKYINSHQWLSDHGGISLLLSQDGNW